MDTNTSEFVLDDGLEEEEDMLGFSLSNSQSQFQSQSYLPPDTVPPHSPPSPPPPTTAAEPTPPPPPPPASKDIPTIPSSDLPSSVTGVIIDGLPLSARRRDLDAVLADVAGDIVSVRLRRLDSHGILRVRVEFNNTTSTSKALQLDGCKYESPSSLSTSDDNDRYLSIKPASDERWNAITGTPSTSNQNLGNAFWSMVSNAQQVAKQLEHKARQLGEKIETELQLDQQYSVSDKVERVSRAGRDMDEKYGLSTKVGAVVENVGNAARIMAKEVDENLRVSDKARDVTNMALSSPTAMGKVTRSVVGSMEKNGGNRAAAASDNRKTNAGAQPRKLDFDNATADTEIDAANSNATSTGSSDL